jgi:hypothetical protein
MAALSSVQLKLDALERFIRTNLNDDTSVMVHLVTEIRASIKHLYLTNGMKPDFDYFKEINELNDTEIIENTDLEQKLHEQLEERCNPLPISNNFLIDDTVQGYSDEKLDINAIVQEDIPLYSHNTNPYIDVLDKIGTLKDLMYKNTMDTSVFDYIDTFVKGIRQKT